MMSEENAYNGPDRRQFTRIPFSFPVRFREKHFNENGIQKEGITKYAYSNDISLSGIQLKFLESVKTGRYLSLKLTLPFDKECIIIHATGEVLWSKFDEKDNIYVVGINFLEIEKYDSKKLEEFISISLKQFSGASEEATSEKIALSADRIFRKYNRPINVLVVDDEKNIRFILDLKLSMKKMFDVDQAESGEEALRKISQKKPDIMLLDIMLPEINGFEICRQLKQGSDTKDIPIIFLSAKKKLDDAIHGIRVGVDDYITKPYEFDDLFCQMIKVLSASTSSKRIISD
ncbi:MAG: response regulator [Candidatus Aureabacteria bacterium]|nr:response regulator [Candidatus Auribacterota bacterium]